MELKECHIFTPGPQQEQKQLTVEPAEQADFLLLELPEPLLLAVLQCLAAAADNHHSLFSAARAHSRLHQAAVAALSSITVCDIQQEQLCGVLLYLNQHTKHISSLSLGGVQGASLTRTTRLRHLPPSLRLDSLELSHLEVQLLPGDGFQGVLWYDGVSPLKQLRLKGCTLLGQHEGLAAALQHWLPRLDHLTLDGVCLDEVYHTRPVALASNILQQRLQQLTLLELAGVELQGPDQTRTVLQPLQALSRLVDLRLAAPWVGADKRAVLAASMLSGAAGLTRLELEHVSFEPRVLAGKAQLQHLALKQCQAPGHDAWTAQLLSQLESLHHLTHLRCPDLTAAAPAPAYSALIASSRLQHLWLSDSTLPAGVWQHVFPAGRQLPHLTCLAAAGVRQPADGRYITVPDGSCLVSCCPGLQRLDVRALESSTGAFAAMQGLSGLRTLLAGTRTGACGALGEVCQLTGLQDLEVHAPREAGELLLLLLQMTQLRQLTRLAYNGPLAGNMLYAVWAAQDPGDQPVWRQVLRAHLNHRDPAVAQQAAAALVQ